jgi:penicillin amidase
MPARRKRKSAPWRRAAAGLAIAVIVITAVAAGYGAWVLLESRPTLSGTETLPGLTAPATVTRDAAGVPTITAATRLDLARATGFIHAQERFFQMDLLRRAGAGELSALVGPAALRIDRAHRIHRFRARAQSVLAAMPAPDRALLEAYAAGANAGLAALGHAPWEYMPLRMAPTPWTPADSLLVVYAMYFDLQASDPGAQLESEAAIATLGPAMAAFLYPKGVPADAPLDGSHLPLPPLPSGTAATQAAPAAGAETPVHGSNNFAVSGALSATGAAIVENDMHLALGVPNIWFRARLAIPGQLDTIGVTLPGVPFVVAGSNTHIAWAFTDAYIESGDAVVIETLPTNPPAYKTPNGPLPFRTITEPICVAHAACESLRIHETIWGPVMAQDNAGRPVAWRWMAHDANAVSLTGFTGLERATTIRQALDAAHTAGLPDENFVAGDSQGHIAWTVIGQIPRREGLTDQLPHSWADGAHAWNGYLAAADIPEIVDPPDGRLWSANARVLGGAAYALLGNGGYASPDRARAIHDDLFTRTRFTEADLLAIATDARAHALDPWQALMHQAIAANLANPAIAALQTQVAVWGGQAIPDSAGYRLVREFRGALIRRIYAGLGAKLAAHLQDEVPLGRNPDWPSLRLLEARPPALVPPPFATWNALVTSALAETARNAGPNPAAYRWGGRNHTGIHHPLAAAIPGLSLLTDPPDVPVAGDVLVPRVAIPGFGASERFVVSPGHENQAIFDMPAGQSDNPLSPYYGAGEAAWVEGAATPLVPGVARWQLRLEPK